MIEPLQSDDALLADVSSSPGDRDTMSLWWLGQSGYLLQSAGTRVVLDPYLSESLTKKYAATEKPHVRMTRRVLAPESLARLGPVAVTSTHAHTDHLDPETLRPLVAGLPHLKLIAPASIAPLAVERSGLPPSRVLTLDAAQSVTVGPFHFTAVPASHPDLARDAAGRHLYLGYVIRFGPFTLYHSGDTVTYPGMADLLRPLNIDVAILPINGKVGNMGGGDAARLAKAISAKLVIPCHYEMFEFNTAAPRDEFIPECERLGQKYKVLRAGERLTLERGDVT